MDIYLMVIFSILNHFMQLRPIEIIESIHVLKWLGQEALPNDLTIRQIISLVRRVAVQKWPQQQIGCALAKRWLGHDPLPEIDPQFGIIEVFRWLTIVEVVTQPNTEIELSRIPPPVQVNRQVGDPWHDTLAYVLLPGANLEARPPEMQSLDTLPITI